MFERYFTGRYLRSLKLRSELAQLSPTSTCRSSERRETFRIICLYIPK